MINEMIFSPLGIFVIFIAISFGLYALGAKMAPKSNDVGGKLTMYACGESLPEKKLASSAAAFFHVALFFTIMDVAALSLSTLPKEGGLMMGIIYIVAIGTAVFALITR